MKCLIVVIFAVVAFVAADEEWKAKSADDLNQLQRDCINESGVTKEHLDLITSNNAVDTKELRDYAFCFTTKGGFFTEEKGYNHERVKAQIEVENYASEKTREAVLKCIENLNTEGNAIDQAYQGFVCILKEERKGRPEN